VDLKDWASVAQIVTGIAFVFAALQIREARKQLHRELENLYVQRYWKILDQMPTWGHDLRQRRVKVGLLRYMQLCEDEIDLRSHGRITDDTWRIWSIGMIVAARGISFQRVFSASDATKWPGLREFLATRRDPLRGGWVVRLWKGLS
jgi:hypothetical protein